MKKIKDEWAPLSAGFMLTSILGFFISIWLIMDLSPTWGFTMTLLFIIMFIASMISMTKAEPIPEHMQHLAIHEPEKAYNPFVRKPIPEQTSKNIKWYEPIFVAYLIFWAYYIVHQIRDTIDYTSIYLAITFFTITVYFTIIFIIDIFSKESLPTWEQIIFALLIIVFSGYGLIFFPVAPIGTLIYYVHTKMLERSHLTK